MVMAKPKRELLKFRPGDCGLKIRKDGALEVAGVSEDSPMIDNKGMVNPVMLFAAAWARKDQKCFEALLTNFKESVKEGFFGQDAKRDYEKAIKLQDEVKTSPAPFLSPPVGPYPEKVEEPVLNPDSKPSVLSLGNEFETVADVASGAVTFEQPAPLTDGGCGNADSDSGAVTFEQPKPYDVNGMLKGRDS
jgi:hypothetical protein